MLFIGLVLVVVGFCYTGSYNRAFGRGKPDYPPNLLVRVLFVGFGLLMIADSLFNIF